MGKIHSKKGASTPTQIVVLLIISIVSLTAVAVLIYGLGGEDTNPQGDAVCTFSNTVSRGSGIFSSSTSNGICPTQLVKIVPDDFSKCNEQFKLEYDTGRRNSAVRKCTAEQFGKLIYRCWQMGGAGALEPNSWACFNVEIAESESEDFKDIKDLKRELSSEVEQIIDCDSVGKPRAECEKDQERLINLTIKRIARNSIKNFFEQSSMTNIRLCMVEEPSEVPKADRETCAIEDCDKDGVDNKLDHCPQTPLSSGFDVSAQGCSAEQVFRSIPSDNIEEINSALLGRVQSAKIGCEDLNTSLQTNEQEIDKTNIEIRAIDEEINSILEEYSASSFALSKKLDQTVAIGSSLPKVANIDKEFLISIMSEVKNDATGKPYCDTIPCRSQLEMDISLNSRALYEVGFCNPPAQKGKILTQRCREGRQRVLVSPAGSGLGGDENPYRDLCRMFRLKLLFTQKEKETEGLSVGVGPCQKATELIFGH